MIRKGEPWGQAADGPPDVDIAGDDAELARVVTERPGAHIRYRPTEDSDLARVVGITNSSTGATEVPMDVLEIDASNLKVTSVNMLVLGVAPDRVRWWHRMRFVTVHVESRCIHAGPATTVVVANGQFLRGHDLVPRGHPGDGRAEVQIYAIDRGERAEMRLRSGTGTHLPHPQIATAVGRSIQIAWAQTVPAEVDGHPRGAVRSVSIHVVPGAYQLLV